MRIMASGLQFPEGPVAMEDGSVLLVEMARETLSRVLPDGRVEVVAKIDGGPNGAAVGPDGCIYICNNGGFNWVREGGTIRPRLQSTNYKGGSIDVVDLATGKIERLYDHCGTHRLNGPNDLVFDGHGGFWFSDLGKRRERDLDIGYVYWARADGSEIREVIGGMISPNGIGLSPDHTVLYAAETLTGRLWSWQITAPGQVHERPWPAHYGGTLVAAADGHTRFDSLAVLESGKVCVASLFKCAIAEIEPVSGSIHYHHFPDLLITNICFGGRDMQSAYITMSYEGRLLQTIWYEPGLQLQHQILPEV
jgi:gluconolactonase